LHVVHVLLPPSEAKNPGGRGRPFRERLERLEGPLGDGRRATVAALRTLVGRDAASAADALLLPPGVASDSLITNAEVLESRTTPALRRYAGVVYEGLGVDALDAGAQRHAARRVLVFSGLLGVARGDEPIPNYRVPAKAELPGLGVAGTFWRPLLDETMPTLVPRGLVVDLRSGDYAAMWRPPREIADRVVTVRVLSPAPRGGHAVISHTSKLAKGRLAAALLRAASDGQLPTTRDDVVAAWRRAGGVDATEGTGGRLDLYTG